MESFASTLHPLLCSLFDSVSGVQKIINKKLYTSSSFSSQSPLTCSMSQSLGSEISTMEDWDSRLMFDRYLYDYLRKNNMLKTAEMFKNEADVNVDPAVPLAIDVRDGFLHEWWLMFYDMYKSRQQANHGTRENPFITLMNSGLQNDASLARQYEMNELTVKHLLGNADWGLSTGDSSSQPIGWPFPGTGKILPSFSSMPHQQELLASTSVLYPPFNVTNSVGEEASSSSVNAASRMGAKLTPQDFEKYVLNSFGVTESYHRGIEDNSLSAESDRERIIPSDSEAASSMLEVTDITSEVSLTNNKFSNVKVNSSSSLIDHNKGGTSTSSCNVQRCSTTADASIVHQVLKTKKEVNQ